MARRSTVKGGASFKRLLHNLPNAADQKVIAFLNAAGPVMVGKMKSIVPVLSAPRPNRTPGALRASISYKVTPQTFNLKVGTLNSKLGRSKLFYGHILDVGRKGGNVKVTRGPKVYPNGINVKALRPLYIISQVKVAFRTGSLPGYRTLIDDILTEASQGVGND